MAIDYLADIKALEDAGIDDATIASHLSARTAKPIPCADTKIVLEGSGAIVEDPVTQQRTGTLITHYQSLSDGNEKSLLSWFISHVMVRGIEINASEYPRSLELGLIVNGLPAELSQVAADIVALGGGQPNAGTVEADVVAARATYEQEQAEIERQDSIRTLQAEIENDFINPAVADGVSTEAEVRAAIKAGL